MILIKYSKILIIGSGPSGYTAAIYTFRANLNPLLITGIDLGGQLVKTEFIENWPGIDKISGLDLMERFFNQIKSMNIELVYDIIYNINYLIKPSINYGDIYIILSDLVIIATGNKPKQLLLNNEKNFLNKGISFCALCDGNIYKNKTIAVIGGGNSALENIIYLSNLARKIYVIHRRVNFSADYILIKNLYNIKFIKNFIFLRLNFIIFEILGDDYNIKYIKIKNKVNNVANVLFITGLFISIGNVPNSFKFLGQLKLVNNYIFTNYLTFTSLYGVFCAGDVQNFIYKQAIISSALGCVSALDSINYYKNLCINV